jgi:hypothetical protein
MPTTSTQDETIDDRDILLWFRNKVHIFDKIKIPDSP